MAEFPKINSFNTRLVPIPTGCGLCSKKNHPVRICPRFLQMTVDDRLAYIQRKQFCSNCFASSHQNRDCTSAHNFLTCQDRHHTLLYRNSGPTTPPVPSDPPRPLSASVPHTISSTSVERATTLLQTDDRSSLPTYSWAYHFEFLATGVLARGRENVYVKRSFNFRRQCRAAVLYRCLHLARSHCRPLSLHLSPKSQLRSGALKLS